MIGRRVAVLGAGLSGLAVANAFGNEGFDGELLLFDAKTEFRDDRTWCWWRVDDVDMREILSTSWERWSLHDGGGSAIGQSTRHPYVHLRSIDYYRYAYARMQRRPYRLDAHFAEGVVALVEDATGVEIRTALGTYRVDAVVDARGTPAGAPLLTQRFAGKHVVTDRAVFDPSTVTLMDFRDAAGDELMRFTYVLPFSPYEALVEDTVVTAGTTRLDDHRREVDRYVSSLGAGRFDVMREESGVLPMGATAHARRRSSRIFYAGTSAGATRASSGYTFVRAQRHARALARAIMRGQEPPAAGAGRFAALDMLLIHALHARIIDGATFFTELQRRVEGDVFGRFMSDASTVADEVAVIAAAAQAMPAGVRFPVRRPLASAAA